MKIEEGKFYRTRGGKKVGPMRRRERNVVSRELGPSRKWPWDAGGVSYTSRGAAFLDGGSDSAGLVAEWVDDPAPAEPITKRALLEKAIDAVADRGLNYGKPEDNFQRIANLWNAHLENRGLRSEWALTAVDVANMMALMKIARLEHQPNHQDSWTDLAGYAACGAEIACKDA